MRIGICSFFQETNSFSPLRTGADALRAGGLLTGRELERKFAGTESEVAGALDVLNESAAQVDFLPSLWLMPAGPLTADALGLFASEFESAFRRLAEQPDAFFISLHGCLAGEDEPDATGWFLEILRSLAPRAFIAASADFHANVTARMLRHADLIVGYRTYPHADLRQTGRRAAASLRRLLADSARPVGVPVRLPMIVPTESSQSSAAPMRGVFERLAEIEHETGWPASCFCPHPWLNVSEFAVTLLSYAPQEQAAHARGLLVDAAQALWTRRNEFHRPMPSLTQAWEQVETSETRPAILVDSGDVVLAGAPGDSTSILRFLNSSNTQLRCLLHVTDPAAAGSLWNEPRGAEFRRRMGAQWGAQFYSPVEISFRIESKSDASYTAGGSYLGGVSMAPGRRLALRWKGHTLVVAENADPAADPAFFRSLGIEPAEYDVIVVKSHNTFRPAYRAITERIVRAATPGATAPDLRALPYRPEMKRLYPLSDAAFVPVEERHGQC